MLTDGIFAISLKRENFISYNHFFVICSLWVFFCDLKHLDVSLYNAGVQAGFRILKSFEDLSNRGRMWGDDFCQEKS